jgi:hypothetical protein
MKPEKRIVMNLLLPSNVTVLIMIVAVGFSMAIGGVGNAHKEHISQHIRWTEVLAGMALYYVLVLVPSIFFTVAMEWFYRRGLKPKSKTAVAVSAACGCAAWLILSELAVLNRGFMMVPRRAEAAGTIEWMALGAVTGLIVGILVKLAEERALKRDHAGQSL